MSAELVKGRINGIPISGYYNKSYEPVLNALVSNLAGPVEIGQSVCAHVGGEVVVDLYGGYQDPNKEIPLENDTIVCMMSTGKAIGAICVLSLADRKLIHLEDPVCKHWPEFSANGKSEVTIAQVLSHLAGIPFPDHAPIGSMYDWPIIIRALEVQAPEWKPGTTPGYHSFTIGFLMGEIVSRVTGKSISEYWRKEIADKFEFDYQIALNSSELARCCDVFQDPDDPFFQLLDDPDTPIGRSWRPLPKDKQFNSMEFRTCGVPDFGHGNARSLAGIYAHLLDGSSLLSKDMVTKATTEVWHEEDAIIGVPLRHGLGFILSCDAFPFSGPAAFGGAGQGGSLGFADPEKDLAFAFATNHANREELVEVNERESSKLIKAVVDCI